MADKKDRNLTIEYRKLSDIVPYEKNARKNDAAIDKVVASIEEFGFNVPILVDENMVIVAGHTRYKAAKAMGMDEVPVIVLADLSEREAAQLRIVDNKTGELSSWDYEKLIYEMDSITELDMSVFEFGDFQASDNGKDEDNLLTNLDEGIELDLSDFEDEAFEFECPYCGFKWNE